MSETSLVIQTIFLLLLILGYTGYLWYTRRKVMRQQREENKVWGSHFSESIGGVLERKSQDTLLQRITQAKKIYQYGDQGMTHIIALASDIQLIACEKHLLIKGSIQSIAAICDVFAIMEQLPEGYCVQLGDWKLFVLSGSPHSSAEDKIVVLPREYWLFMSCKFRDSIYGEDFHPYVYVYEPFTFRKVLAYGIGVEAVNFGTINKEVNY